LELWCITPPAPLGWSAYGKSNAEPKTVQRAEIRFSHPAAGSEPKTSLVRNRHLCKPEKGRITEMSRQIELKGRRFWILSEPCEDGWKATIDEAQDDGTSESLGLLATGETRVEADDAAERKLRRLLQAY
jgi:hypothetical protein